jgi:hypothetical protein
MSGLGFPQLNMATIRRAARYAGVNRAVAFGTLARIWSMVSGLVGIVVLATFFTPQLQGFYYTFLSLIALQIFAELGLGQVIIQFAAHEWAHLRLDGEGRIAGDPRAEARLSGLAHFSVRWFAVASIIFLFSVEGVGFFVFRGKGANVAWQGPWTALCVVVAVDLFLLPLWSLLEGTNQIVSIYFLRFVRSVGQGVALWIAIAAGAGLWSAPISIAIGICIMATLSLRRHYRFFADLFGYPPDTAHGWRAEVWPMQWRIALSWLSGYLAFSLFTPVLFRFQGPVAAGQMGMSWNIVQSLSGIAGMLVQTKAPTFGMLIAQRKWSDLDQLAFRVGVSSIAIAIAGVIAILASDYALNEFHVPFARRLLPFVPFMLLTIGMIAVQVTIPMSVYLRAHKREPLLALSVGTGLMIGASTIGLGYYFGQMGMTTGYAAISVFVVLPWATFILLRFRSLWHAES